MLTSLRALALVVLAAAPAAQAQLLVEPVDPALRGSVYESSFESGSQSMQQSAAATCSVSERTISVSGSTATATFTLSSACRGEEISFSSYALPGGDVRPFEDQVLFRNTTARYGPGQHTVSIGVPGCAYQVDLYEGPVQRELTTKGHQGGVLRAKTDVGAAKACRTTGTPSGFEDGSGGSSSRFASTCAANGSQGQSVEFYGIGMGSDAQTTANPATIAFPNPESVDYVVAQVVVKGERPAAVAFESGGQYVLLTDPTAQDADGFFYRVRMGGGAGEVTASVNTGGKGAPKNTPRAFNLYVVRSGAGGGQVAGLFSERDVFVQRTASVSETISLPPARAARDIAVQYALTDTDRDNRVVIVRMAAGDVVVEQTVGAPNSGDEAYIGTTTLAGVPAGVTDVTVTVTSPQGNGDSVFLGAVAATSRGDCLAALGDTVYADDNRNRRQDGGEAGLPGVTVTLATPGPDATCGTSDDVFVANAETAADGTYLFDDLAPGDYCAAPDAADADLPAGFVPTTSSVVAKTLAAGETFRDADFGFAANRVSPVLECVISDGGTTRAFWGYDNTSGGARTIRVGPANRFVGAPNGDAGQPIEFAAGRRYQVFSTTFTGANQTWTLDGKTATASATGETCKTADLELIKRVDESHPVQGDSVTFTLTLENKGPDATAFVQVTDVLPAGLEFAGASASRGAYDAQTGIWDLSAAGAGSDLPVGTYTLMLTTRVTTPGEVTNTAEVTRSAKRDPDSTPANGDRREDDWGKETITPRQPALSADLSLTKTVDHPAPQQGETVAFTITVRNSGPADATGVSAADKVPAGLRFEAVTSGDGARYDASDSLIVWTIGALAVGDSATLVYTAEVEAEGTFVNVARVLTSDQPDDDSTPGNHNPAEDDQDAATVTTKGSSGGGDAGVESQGSMASLLAQRLFERRQDARARTALMAAPSPMLMRSSSMTTGGVSGGGLGSIVPARGPAQSVAYETTPGDLIGVTNATSIFAADYLRPEGRRMGALFAALSPAGTLYDHAKATCDRLGGGRLESIGLIDIGGRPFVMQHLIHADGSVDYAVSFVAYRSGTEFEIDSRFAYTDYAPSGSSDVVNVQVWSVSPAYTAELAEQVLAEIAGQGSVRFRNSYQSAPLTPGTYVVDGRYEEGNLHLRLAGTPSGTLTVSGKASRTETEAAQGRQTEFAHTIELPAVIDADAPFTSVVVPVGTLFDAQFSVRHGSSEAVDQLYYADGAWSYTADAQSSVQRYATHADTREADAEDYHVERSAGFGGTVVDFASLFRYLRPAGQPVDLAGYEALAFTATGSGRYSVVVEKASIQSWDQHQFEIALTGGTQDVAIPLGDLRRSAGGEGLDPSDVTLVAFYALGDGQSAQPFDLTVENVRFTRNTRYTSSDADAQPGGLAIVGNAPNPFSGTTEIAFTLPQAMDARVEVYDLTGRRVAVAVDRTLTAGTHRVPFAADGLTAGVYLFRLITPEGTRTGQMTIVR
jgi:uncharacterized repeat protein (TIGR01451 family)